MSKKYRSPREMYSDLFFAVHKAGIFADGKVFADSTARLHPDIILKTYRKEVLQDDFDLFTFVNEYFDIPLIGSTDIKPYEDITEHIQHLWQVLRRDPDNIKANRSSKVPLPHPYIVPGGRFNEIYYWDSYFTMLGLAHHGHHDLIMSMVDNFKYLIETFGHIPNGNRSYFLSRSQPPFYSLMVKLLLQLKGQELIPKYLPTLISEYNFWMKGITDIYESGTPVNRVIKLDKSSLLNRYFDDKDTPREEMYRNDWELINFDEEKSRQLFRDIRAACESGWDFSSRWLSDLQDLSTIHTTDILPVDLNCLLWHLEKLISECHKRIGEEETALRYGVLALNRKKAIQDYCWDDDKDCYYDYDYKKKSVTGRDSLAMMYPLFFNLSSQDQADAVAKKIQQTYLHKGGLVTTPINNGQQWDSPNGWAPLHWISVKGLLNYGHKQLAQEIALRWTQLNKQVFKNTGKLLEKYNVVDTDLESGGGEYPVQDGFGWTNGVYIALTKA